jgi:hypothetical protein
VQRLPSIVVVTSPTRFQGLLARWGTKGQAKFRLKQAVAHQMMSGSPAIEETQAEADFDLYEEENLRYEQQVEALRDELDLGFPVTLLERRYLPSYEFRNAMAVVVIGPDGLVANTAKYVGDLPIIGVNPDPRRNDGVLLPFSVGTARSAVQAVFENRAKVHPATMAEASLNDGQRLLAFNDLFIGRRTHASARYNLTWNGAGEAQSSSGVIVATGAGSSGWLSSVFNMQRGLNAWTFSSEQPESPRWQMQWQERKLAWVVREPFVSRHSSAELVVGTIESGGELVLESLMPEGGAVFSDGIESDYLEFNSGTTVRVRIADQQARIVVP